MGEMRHRTLKQLGQSYAWQRMVELTHEPEIGWLRSVLRCPDAFRILIIQAYSNVPISEESSIMRLEFLEKKIKTTIKSYLKGVSLFSRGSVA